MEETVLRRKKELPFIVCILFLLGVTVMSGCDMKGVQKKVTDYWEEQSSEYTAFKKELTAGTILEKTLYVESISENKYAYRQLD